MMIAPKLTSGDEIRIVAPSQSAGILSEDTIHKAVEQLSALGLRVTFGAHIYEHDVVDSSSIESRIEDLHAAFRDTNVKGVLAVIGGYNANELLPFLDYELIRENPKVFCGYSDTTALSLAIWAKTGIVTYSGPSFSSFGMVAGQAYQRDSFVQCVMESTPLSVQEPVTWSDDKWYIDQEKRHFRANGGLQVYSEGAAKGTVIGGNLCTFNLLQGTAYMPDITDSILFLEDDFLTNAGMFARDLTSLLHQPGADTIRGLVIGKFQDASGITVELLRAILDKHPVLKQIPVVYNASFGHIQPIFTFPVGGTASLDTAAPSLVFQEH